MLCNLHYRHMRLFETIKPEILSKIEAFSKRNRTSLFEKIKAEEDLLNLKSLLTESHFGMYFEQIGEAIRYNQKIGSHNQTPDFLFKLNGQEIIAEVCHINPTQNDMNTQRASDAEHHKFKCANPDDYWIDGPHSIEWKPEKVGGKKGSLTQKAKKYGPLAEQLDRPLLLCVYLEFTSAIDSLDLNHSLYGYPGEYIGEFPFQGYYPNTKFHDLKDALYYSEPQMMKNVSGVLLRENNGAFLFYSNFSSTNRLSLLNLSFLLEKQHPYQ